MLPLLIKGAAGSPPRPAALVFGVMDGDDLMAINMGEAITVERSQKNRHGRPWFRNSALCRGGLKRFQSGASEQYFAMRRCFLSRSATPLQSISASDRRSSEIFRLNFSSR